MTDDRDYDALAAKLAEVKASSQGWIDAAVEQQVRRKRAEERILEVEVEKARAESAEAKLAKVTDDCDDLQIALASARKQLERYIADAEAALPAVYRLALADAEFACTNVIKNYDVTYDGGKKFAPMKTQNAAKGMVSIAREDICALPTPTAAELMARIQTGEKE